MIQSQQRKPALDTGLARLGKLILKYNFDWYNLRDRWDQPQDLVQVKRSKLKKLLIFYGAMGGAVGVSFGLYLNSIGVC